jgi:protein-S-isoprenylcysteine O-methyltransferase Ste14
LEVLLYLGWITLAFGIVLLLWSSQSRKKGHISEIKTISKETLVESGMYAFVRHPEFLGHILIISALVLIAQHWVSLIIGAMLVVLLYLAMIEEEKRNIEKFGDRYRDYMQKVPRINLLTGIIRQMHSKEGNKKER